MLDSHFHLVWNWFNQTIIRDFTIYYRILPKLILCIITYLAFRIDDYFNEIFFRMNTTRISLVLNQCQNLHVCSSVSLQHDNKNINQSMYIVFPMILRNKKFMHLLLLPVIIQRNCFLFLPKLYLHVYINNNYSLLWFCKGTCI